MPESLLSQIDLKKFFAPYQALADILAPFATARAVLKDGVEPGEVATLMRAAAQATNMAADLLDKIIVPTPPPGQ
jgi:hypothetical protein